MSEYQTECAECPLETGSHVALRVRVWPNSHRHDRPCLRMQIEVLIYWRFDQTKRKCSSVRTDPPAWARLVLILAACCLLRFAPVYSQSADIDTGQVIHTRIYSEAIATNTGGEDPLRRLSIYLPPGYHDSDQRYPVIYYLHGFTWNDSLHFAQDGFHHLMDQAVHEGLLRNTIVVAPNQYTLFKGSFTTNSTLTGNWEDFIADEVVEHIDTTYRTLPNRLSRGIAGHSMGGNGALKLGMLRSDVFSVVYALSPAVLDWSDDFGLTNPSLKMAHDAQTREKLFEDFYATVFVAMCRAYSPNENSEPFQCDLPASFSGDEMRVRPNVVEKWDAQFPTTMIADHVENLSSLTALKLDWGRNEQFDHIRATARDFSEELETLGIEHYAEEYIGTHGNKRWTQDGRALNDMLPFFNMFLEYE